MSLANHLSRDSPRDQAISAVNRVASAPRNAPEVVRGVGAMGPKITAEPNWAEASAGMVIVMRDPKTGAVFAGADPRRSCYAAGW